MPSKLIVNARKHVHLTGLLVLLLWENTKHKRKAGAGLFCRRTQNTTKRKTAPFSPLAVLMVPEMVINAALFSGPAIRAVDGSLVSLVECSQSGTSDVCHNGR